RQSAAEQRAREALADLESVNSVECADATARRIRLAFADDSPVEARRAAAERLAELGLEADIS
ncbi:MAG: hypothetical protein M3177_04580, partial [Pseudomonadota bacterium]|nr:hypothetical protein [Pseudomonadota bacterium]